MSFLDVTSKNQLQELDSQHKMGKNIFVLIYMNGCGPCNETKPEWKKLENQFRDIIVAQIDKDTLPPSDSNETFCLDVDGFPTIRNYNGRKKIEYNSHRKVEHFKKWIKKQIGRSKTKRKNRKMRRSRRR